MVRRSSFNIRGNYLDNSRLSGNNNFRVNENKTINENLNMIQHIKKNIISNIIIHYYRKDFSNLKNHLLLKENYIKQINVICSQNIKLKNEFEPYIILMDALENYMNIMKKVNYLEEANLKKGKDNINSMIYEFTELKVKTEYEIYNIIFGKPNIKNREKYDSIRIIRIKKLLNNPSVTFDDIEKILKNQQ